MGCGIIDRCCIEQCTPSIGLWMLCMLCAGGRRAAPLLMSGYSSLSQALIFLPLVFPTGCPCLWCVCVCVKAIDPWPRSNSPPKDSHTPSYLVCLEHTRCEFLLQSSPALAELKRESGSEFCEREVLLTVTSFLPETAFKERSSDRNHVCRMCMCVTSVLEVQSPNTL